VLGSDERARGVVTIKDMKTGEQTQVRRDALATLDSPRVKSRTSD
jgi:histidyl-tRNA synthetase